MNNNIEFIENEAYQKSNVNAIFILGYLYFKGIILNQNNEKAKKILEKGIHLNCPFCINLLGKIYELEKNSICIDFYQQAIDLNFVYSKVDYALIKKNGTYTKSDINYFLDSLQYLSEESVNFYLAQYILGSYYLNETKEYEKAIVYLFKATKNYHVLSRNILQNIFLNKYEMFKIPKTSENNLFWKYYENAKYDMVDFNDHEIKLFDSAKIQSERKIKDLTENIADLKNEIKLLKINCENHSNNNRINNNQVNKKNINCACSIF